ncbi:MAG: 3-keto-5-aminohexanoate cleavage protein [Streptosporangiaceae bacterium]|nr:3-keto-5-aminohexanoate cleavage protein [Streptosporangiaceae bacterium]MBV9858038.1 3-keto-5-aminohexanoate cleavage protein [Streptosporangiaceae bacterium]
MLVKACLNGGTTRAKHPSVPQTPDELAADALAACQAGAGAVHIHPRDAPGAETLEPDAVLAAVAAVRAVVPGVPVGVTTGIWAVGGDPARRIELVARWTGPDRPDFASVNLSEPGTDELADLLRGLGIPVEAGVWSAADADRLAASSFADRVIRVLIEPPDEDGASAVATAAEAEAALDRHGIGAPRLHHGYGLATWDVIRAALALGRDIRVGLEDTTVLPDGSRATGNADLVAAAVRMASSADRPPDGGVDGASSPV